jgi:predicted Zn-ribbon and HTH transcriptional regulator
MNDLSEAVVRKTTLDLDKSCYCWQCGYEWTSRKRRIPPAVCPRCKKDNWDIHRRFKCQECGYIFASVDLSTPAYQLFPVCPNCQNHAWHKQIEDKLAQLYHQGMECFHAGKWQAAIEKFDAMLLVKSGHKDAAKKRQEARRAQVEEELTQLYRQGMEYFYAEKWYSAIKKFKAVQRIDPDYKDVTLKCQEAQHARRTQLAVRRAARRAEEKAHRARHSILGVLPKDIDTKQRFGEFGFATPRAAARVIVWFCQEKGNRWVDFTFSEINTFYKNYARAKYNPKDFSFGELIREKYVKRFGLFVTKYRVTEKFIRELKNWGFVLSRK